MFINELLLVFNNPYRVNLSFELDWVIIVEKKIVFQRQCDLAKKEYIEVFKVKTIKCAKNKQTKNILFCNEIIILGSSSI